MMVFASSRVSSAPFQPIFSSRSDSPWSSAILRIMNSRSEDLSHWVFSGKSATKKNATTANTQVASPARMKIHLHAWYPLIPFMCPMPVARRPPNAPANVAAFTKKVNLR